MASDYAALHTVRRILKRRPDLQLEWRQVQKEYEQNEEARQRSMGPGIAFREISNHLGWRCEEGLSIQRKDRSWMHLLDTEEEAFSHMIREDQRRQAWSCEAMTKRTCYDEVKNVGIDYSETVKHLRRKIDGKKKEKWVHPKERHDDQPSIAARTQDKHNITAEERGALRSVMCNSAFTMETLTKIRGKARQQHDTCPFCDQGVCEDEDHMFWKCPAHEQVRRETREKCTNQKLEELPRMTKICGLVPNNMEPGEIKRAQDVQLMLMQVWLTRCKIAVSKWGKRVQRHEPNVQKQPEGMPNQMRKQEKRILNKTMKQSPKRYTRGKKEQRNSRTTTTNAITLFPGPTVEVKVNRASWGFRRSWLDPFQWYWRQMSLDTKRSTQKPRHETLRGSLWHSTSAPRLQKNLLFQENERKTTRCGKMVQHFKAASLNLMKKLKVKAPKHAEQSRVMAPLGLGKLTAVEGRARLLRPEAVNRAIHALAIQALTTEYKVFMKSLVRLPSPGKPLYDPHGHGEHEHPEPERKYLRTHPQRRMENFPWKPGQREYTCKPPKICEDHRRNAAGTQLYRRGKAVPRSRSLQQGSTRSYVYQVWCKNQERARTHCSGIPVAEGGLEIIGLDAKAENRCTAARARNEQVDTWNTRNWAQLPRRHHYDQIVLSNVHRLRCIRPNSGKEYHVKTLSCNLNSKSLGNCQVKTLWLPVLWFRFCLCHQLSSRGRQR